jgi:translation elongation factor EF-Tu-like GTPase
MEFLKRKLEKLVKEYKEGNREVVREIRKVVKAIWILKGVRGEELYELVDMEVKELLSS